MDFHKDVEDLIKEKKIFPMDEGHLYDVLILGGGPAGLSAAVYCMRKNVSTGIILKELGGQVASTAGIENYMGYRYINGSELSEKFREQVAQFGIGYDEGVGVSNIIDGKIKKVILEDGRSLTAKAIIIASGKDPRRLNVQGEIELTGKGVAYNTIRDTPFFVDKRVFVAGGGNSGVECAIDLSRVAEHVTIIQHRDKLTADNILLDKLNDLKNLDVIYECQVTEICGEDCVDSIMLKDKKTDELKKVHGDGIFIEIGLAPNSGFARGVVDLNDFGEIIIDSSCKTSKPGIFAAGDVTNVPYKQIIVAAGEGAKAALSACDYILRV